MQFFFVLFFSLYTCVCVYTASTVPYAVCFLVTDELLHDWRKDGMNWQHANNVDYFPRVRDDKRKKNIYIYLKWTAGITLQESYACNRWFTQNRARDWDLSLAKLHCTVHILHSTTNNYYCTAKEKWRSLLKPLLICQSVTFFFLRRVMHLTNARTYQHAHMLH